MGEFSKKTLHPNGVMDTFNGHIYLHKPCNTNLFNV